MRTLAFLLHSRHTHLSGRRIPDPHNSLDREVVPRRLEDQVEDVFARSLTIGDFEACSDLLALLDKWSRPGRARFARERRRNGVAEQRVRRELDRMKNARHTRR